MARPPTNEKAKLGSEQMIVSIRSADIDLKLDVVVEPQQDRSIAISELQSGKTVRHTITARFRDTPTSALSGIPLRQVAQRVGVDAAHPLTS
jgi:hypothetical protein